MDKMKRLSSLLLVGAMLLSGWARADQNLPVVPAENLAGQLDGNGDGADDADGATRGRKGCKIKSVRRLIACDIVANSIRTDNLYVNQNLVVYGNEEVAGNLTVDGDLIVRGNYVPLTINLTPGTNKISTALAGLSNDNQNFGSVLINLAPGTYNESNFTFTNQVQAVTFIGDTNPLAGVSFMQGGIYGGPAYNVQRQLNPQIGLGCNYNIGFDASGTEMTVTADTPACLGSFAVAQPDLSGLVGYTLFFMGVDGLGTTLEAVVTSAINNTVTLNAVVGGVLPGTTTSSTTSTPGVAFTVEPKVIIQDTAAAVSNFVGIKNLKFQGVYFHWNNNNDLYLGGVNTKMELSNCILRSSPTTNIFIGASQAYNRQPNTFIDTVASLPTSTLDFVFNTVILRPFGVLGSSGSFSFGQNSFGGLVLLEGAHINADSSRIYNSNQQYAIDLDGASLISLNNALVANSRGSGIGLLNGSTLTTIANSPVSSINNIGTGLVLQLAASAIIVGAVNADFSGNANAVAIDSLPPYATLGAVPNGVPDALNSYVKY
jgi:hypothetical protein